jgi:MoaA/NifB/PqqE/SkfB family radical SAM enzyme
VIPERDPRELTTEEGFRLIEQLAEFGSPSPNPILTGGDPLKRSDFLALAEYTVASGLPVSVSPSVTTLLTLEKIQQMKAAGVEAMSLSLDGSSAERHDSLRCIPGTFDRTLEAARDILEAGNKGGTP